MLAAMLSATSPATARTGKAELSARTGAPIAPAAPAPRPGRVQTFGDWALGCDNLLSCTLVSLLPENASEPYAVLLTIQLESAAGASPVLRLLAFDQMRGKLDLQVDGTVIASVTASRDVAEISGAPALRVIRALTAGYSLEFRQKQAVVSRMSLAGLRDALIALDGQQGRTGTTAALIALGSGNASRVRSVPVRPVVPKVTPPPHTGNSPALSATEETEARRLAVCDGRLDAAYPVESHDLGGGQVLVLLPCNAAAYNVSVVPLIARGTAGTRSFSIARFDQVPGETGAPGAQVLLVNPRWNPRTGQLSSFAKGRGLGDCGTAEDYVWDGSMFRLIEARAMPMCRGAWEWPRIWSAETKRG
jgi:hypothetical protein